MSAATWLASLAVAQSTPAASAAPASSSRLQSLVNAAHMQFKIAYRNHEAEQLLRREQLAAAINAWREAARSGANNQRLADWLRGAIHNSMPGSREPLPPLPEFDRLPVVVVAPAPTPTRTTTNTTTKKPVAQIEAQHGVEPQPAPPATKVNKADDVDIFASSPETAVAPATSKPSSEPASKAADTDGWDFWSEHPSEGELPADLKGGDPFRDDPAASSNLFE